uniref:Uncharacterized protein n=1 Tax=Corethron hystrix TaxID=216773 RepID=A0A7S1BYC9_9STRA
MSSKVSNRVNQAKANRLMVDLVHPPAAPRRAVRVANADVADNRGWPHAGKKKSSKKIRAERLTRHHQARKENLIQEASRTRRVGKVHGAEEERPTEAPEAAPTRKDVDAFSQPAARLHDKTKEKSSKYIRSQKIAAYKLNNYMGQGLLQEGGNPQAATPGPVVERRSVVHANPFDDAVEVSVDDSPAAVSSGKDAFSRDAASLHDKTKEKSSKYIRNQKIATYKLKKYLGQDQDPMQEPTPDAPVTYTNPFDDPDSAVSSVSPAVSPGKDEFSRDAASLHDKTKEKSSKYIRNQKIAAYKLNKYLGQDAAATAPARNPFEDDDGERKIADGEEEVERNSFRCQTDWMTMDRAAKMMQFLELGRRTSSMYELNKDMQVPLHEPRCVQAGVSGHAHLR